MVQGEQQAQLNSNRSEAGADNDEAVLFDSELLNEYRRYRRRVSWQAWTLRIGLFVGAIAAWWAIGTLGLLSTGIVGNPVLVGEQILAWLPTSYLWSNLWSTLKAALVGLALGTVLGVSIGVFLARIEVVRRATRPYVTFFNAMPRPALAPLFVVWFGLGIEAKATAAVSIVFFIMLMTAMAGIENVDPDIRQLARSLDLSGSMYFRRIELPSALPALYSGLRLSAAGAVLGVIVDEIVAAYKGLGQIFVRASSAFAMEQVYAIVIIISLVALILEILAWLLQRALTKG